MQRTEAAPTNLQIVLGSAAGAGLLAALLAALDREERERGGETEVRQVIVEEHHRNRGWRDSGASPGRVAQGIGLASVLGGQAVENTRMAARKARLEARESRALQRAERSARDAVEQGRRTARTAMERIGEVRVDGRGEVTQRVSQRAQRVGGQAAAAVQSSAKQAAGVAEMGLERARGAGSLLSGSSKNRWPSVSLRVGEQIVPAAQSVLGQVSSAAGSGAGRAKEAGSVVASTAKERVPQISHRVTSDVVPSLRELAVQAASTALDLWESTRELAADAADTVQADIRPQAARAIATSSVRAKEAGTIVTEKAGEVGGRARAASRQAADATVETSKDTGAMLFWGAAAGSLIYYALLGPEERAKLASTVTSVTDQVRELIKDFQGYDEEF